MAKYKISRKAISDLNSIWEYTADTWSEAQADKYYYKLRNAISNLSDLPPYLVKNYDVVKTGLLGYRVGHHIILYRAGDDCSIYVDRILHEKMDFIKHV